MLYNLDGDEMDGVPSKRQTAFNRWRGRLSDQQYQRIVDAVNSYIDGKDYFISSFIPGQDWVGTVYEPIEAACDHNRESSSYFFGLIVWLTVIERADEWIFKMADKNTEDIMGTTYFKKR